MPKTEVILTHNIVGLGAESDQVKVAAGYARNYLYPQGLAIPVSGTNKRRLEVLRQRRADREAHELNTMSELGKSVSKLICVLTVKTGEDGKMFGTVTSGMIADQLKTQFDISLDKKKIHLEHPIHALGEHEVELRLHQEVHATLKVRVESTTPLPAPPEAPAGPQDRREDRGQRTEKRGHRPEAGEKPGKGEKGEKTEGAEKRSSPPRGERPRGDRPPRVERPAKPAAGEKPAKAQKPAGEKPAVAEKAPTGEPKPAKAEKSAAPETPPKAEPPPGS
jgi:large subunit ribosomal protein L9